jgi:hypothetical protein
VNSKRVTEIGSGTSNTFPLLREGSAYAYTDLELSKAEATFIWGNDAPFRLWGSTGLITTHRGREPASLPHDTAIAYRQLLLQYKELTGEDPEDLVVVTTAKHFNWDDLVARPSDDDDPAIVELRNMLDDAHTDWRTALAPSYQSFNEISLPTVKKIIRDAAERDKGIISTAGNLKRPRFAEEAEPIDIEARLKEIRENKDATPRARAETISNLLRDKISQDRLLTIKSTPSPTAVGVEVAAKPLIPQRSSPPENPRAHLLRPPSRNSLRHPKTRGVGHPPPLIRARKKRHRLLIRGKRKPLLRQKPLTRGRRRNHLLRTLGNRGPPLPKHRGVPLPRILLLVQKRPPPRHSPHPLRLRLSRPHLPREVQKVPLLRKTPPWRLPPPRRVNNPLPRNLRSALRLLLPPLKRRKWTMRRTPLDFSVGLRPKTLLTSRTQK